MNGRTNSVRTISVIYICLALTISPFLIVCSSQEYQTPEKQNIVANLYQGPKSEVTMNAGQYSINLKSPGSITSIPYPGFQLVNSNANYTATGLGTDISDLTASENSSSLIDVGVYYQNNGSLAFTKLGSSVQLAGFIIGGGLFPVNRVIAQYSTGSLVISNQLLNKGINGSMKYNSNYLNLSEDPSYSMSHVNSLFEFTISPKYGESLSTLRLSSISQFSGLIVYFTPGSYAALNIGGYFYNVTGKLVNLEGFTEATVQFTTDTNSNFTIPYLSIASMQLAPVDSPSDTINFTAASGQIAAFDGPALNVSGPLRINSETPISVTENGLLIGKQYHLKYAIETNFAQGYKNNTALFTVSHYVWTSSQRIAGGLIAGSLIGGAISQVFEGLRNYFSKNRNK